MNKIEVDSGQDMPYQKILRTIEEGYSSIVEKTNLIIYDLNLENDEIVISDDFYVQGIDEYSKRNAIGHIFDLNTIHPDDTGKFKNYMEKEIPSDALTYRRKNQSGMYSWIRSNRKKIFNEQGKVIRVLGTEQDVSAEMETYELLRMKEKLDELTRISDYQKFTSRVSTLLNKNSDKNYAMVVFDIDKFRIVNDLYGAEQGDKLLEYIAQALKKNIIEPDLYCRMYTDHFAIFMEYEKEADFALTAIVLAEEIARNKVGHETMLSFGVCIVDDNKTSVPALCDRACLAKKTVKGNYVQLLAFYDETLRIRDMEDKDIESEMLSALKHNEFVMYLQPKLTIATTEVIGAEALIRWIHPAKGVISPDRFIPLFEKNGFIVKMDHFVWDKAFGTVRDWMDKGYKPVPISVNVSRLHLYNNNLVTCLTQLAEKYNVPKNLIELELTETALFKNQEKIADLVCKLKKEGFLISMDDFGSGYSNLNMLKDIPVDIIKIDRGFMSEMTLTERGKTVIQHTIAMAKQLKIDVIAEGVENFMQAEFLFESGCEKAQGFFYSKPLPINKFEQYTYGNSVK